MIGPRMSAETVRQLGAAAGLRPAEADLDELAESLMAIIEAVERCEELGLEAYEPATSFRFGAGADDADR